MRRIAELVYERCNAAPIHSFERHGFAAAPAWGVARTACAPPTRGTRSILRMLGKVCKTSPPIQSVSGLGGGVLQAFHKRRAGRHCRGNGYIGREDYAPQNLLGVAWFQDVFCICVAKTFKSHLILGFSQRSQSCALGLFLGFARRRINSNVGTYMEKAFSLPPRAMAAPIIIIATAIMLGYGGAFLFNPDHKFSLFSFFPIILFVLFLIFGFFISTFDCHLRV